MSRSQTALLIVLLICCGLIVAQQSASPGAVSSSKHAAKAKSALDEGSIVNGTYQNHAFQFAYKLPFGWVDRTSEMREDVEAGKSMVLLSIFERPPAARVATVNSAVIIAAESADSYAGLKGPADYFGPLTELAESNGLKAVNDPYEFPVGGRTIVRRDFSKDNSGVSAHQSSLVLLARGHVLSFTFIAGSDDDIVQLIERLSFGPMAR